MSNERMDFRSLDLYASIVRRERAVASILSASALELARRAEVKSPMVAGTQWMTPALATAALITAVALPALVIIDRISLTAEQRKSIDAILEKHRKQADGLWQAQKPVLRGIVDSTRGEIRAQLTPDQRAEYDRLLEQRRAQHKKNGCSSDNQQG